MKKNQSSDRLKPLDSFVFILASEQHPRSNRLQNEKESERERVSLVVAWTSIEQRVLLVDPSFSGMRPVGHFFSTEPQVDFTFGGLVGVAAVNDVTTSAQSQVELSESVRSYRPVTMEKSPRMVPGSDFDGSVAPSIFRPTLMTFTPSQTVATTGPLPM